MQTRRDLLKFIATMAGAAGASNLIPEAIARAYAIEPTPGSTFADAEHIVILMQENRSFDHAFGTMRGVRGFNDPRALRLANGNSVFVQTDAEGHSYAPWRLDIKDTRITWMGSLPHSRESQVDAWNAGLHDGWLDAKRSGEKPYERMPLTMGHYTREDLPFYYALADAFTVCDQNYCSVMTSTSPNRCYFWTGSIREEQSPTAHAHIRNEQIDYGGLTWKTFPERLHEAGVSWKHYQNEITRSSLVGEDDSWLSNYGDNPLECFEAYNVEAHPGFVAAAKRWQGELTGDAANIESQLPAEEDPAKAAAMRAQLEAIHKQAEKLSAAIIKGGSSRVSELSADERALHEAAFVTNTGDPHYHTLEPLSFEAQGKQHSIQVPKGDVLYQFRKDVDEGKLPAVSWLTASERFSDHPSSPWFGAWYISEIINILTKNPEVWKKTIFILTYDENDGYFDHAPSYVAADPKRSDTGGASEGINTGLEYIYREDELAMGVKPEHARTAPIGMGFRVPMIVASPWTRGGWVNSQLFDHTSTLQFLEQFVQQKYGKTVHEENISSWRRTVAGDLTSVFRPHDPSIPTLDYLDRDKSVISIAQARYREIPSNYHQLDPTQIEKINHTPRISEHLPHQEPGTRPSCALPYELSADCTLTADGQQWELHLTAGNQAHGAQSAGAPFNVYLRTLPQPDQSGKNKMQAATYAVKAGDTLTLHYPADPFNGAPYAIEVHAPNGFYRAYTANQSASNKSIQTAEVRASYERQDDNLTGKLLLHLRNTTAKAAFVHIADNAYKAAPIRKHLQPKQEITVPLSLEKSHGWYDFTIAANGTDATTRLAGRIETGKPSISDPAMA